MTRTALEEFVRTAAPGARTISTVTRLHHVAQRRHLGVGHRGPGGRRRAAPSCHRRGAGSGEHPAREPDGVGVGERRARPDRHGARDPGWSTRRPGNPRSAASRRRGCVRAGSTASSSGWSARAVRAAARPLHVGAIALNSHGDLLPLTPLGVAVARDVVGGLRSPPSGYEVVPGPLHVAGVAQPDAPIAFVEIAVDGVSHGRARPFSHDDTTGVHTRALSGFEHVVDIDPERVGATVVVTASVATVDGRMHSCDELTLHVVGRSVSADPTRSRGPPSWIRWSSPNVGCPARVGVFTHSLDLGGAQLWLHEVVRHLRERGDYCCVVSAGDGPLRAELDELGVPVIVHDAVLGPPTPEATARLSEVIAALDLDVAIVNTVVASAAAGRWRRSTSRWSGPSTSTSLRRRSGTRPTVATTDPSGEHFAELLCGSDRLTFVSRRDARPLRHADRLEFGTGGDPYGVSVDARSLRLRAADGARSLPGRPASDLPTSSRPRSGRSSPGRAKPRSSTLWPPAAPSCRRCTWRSWATPDRSTRDPWLVSPISWGSDPGCTWSWRPGSPSRGCWQRTRSSWRQTSNRCRAAMEAMAFRLPVVLGDVGGCADLVDAGQVGRLVAPRDVGSLVGAARTGGDEAPRSARTAGDTARLAVEANHGDLSYVRGRRALDHVLAEHAREHQPAPGIPAAR